MRSSRKSLRRCVINLADMETAYKVFRREALRHLRIEEARFGCEPEITAKLAQPGVPVLRGRGFLLRPHLRRRKKIGWRDGVRALWAILKYNVWKRQSCVLPAAESADLPEALPIPVARN